MAKGNISRRALLESATAAACLAAFSKAGASPTEWKPRLGILGRYSEANVDFAIQERFNNMILSAGAGAQGLDTTKLTDEGIGRIKSQLSSKGMHVSALQVNANHIAPDPAERERENSNFVKAIQLAGKLGVPYIGTQSGKDVSKTFEAQVDEIDWPAFFSVLQSVGYAGAMSIEHEDELYGAADNPGPDFSEPYKVGFRMAKRYLNQYVPV